MSDAPPKPCDKDHKIINSDTAINLDGIIDFNSPDLSTGAAPPMNNDIIEGSRQTVYLTTSTERKQLVSLFGIYVPNRQDVVHTEWELYHRPYLVPDDLERNLEHFAQASFNWASGMSARVGLAILIVQCKLSFNRAFPRTHNTTAGNQIIGPMDPTDHLSCGCDIPYIRTLPDRDLSVQIQDHGKPDIVVAGRADWVFAYGSQDDVSKFFGTIVVKGREHLFTAEDQLLAHLAIIRQHRMQAKGSSCAVGGFYTDGMQYVFMMISEDGNIFCSRLYNVYRPGELKTIFNFVLAILESGVYYMDEEEDAKSRKERLDMEMEMGMDELPGEIDGI